MLVAPIKVLVIVTLLPKSHDPPSRVPGLMRREVVFFFFFAVAPPGLFRPDVVPQTFFVIV